jgi:molecular chaperone GrpE
MMRKRRKSEIRSAVAPDEKDPGDSAVTAPAEEVPEAAGGDHESERMAALEMECARLNDARLRTEAELANYRRRAVRERDEAELRAKEQVLGEVMALADDLERALDAAEEGEAEGPILNGVRLVHERVRDILASHGVEIIDPLGQPFDPHEADALLEMDSAEFKPGTVAQVIEKGYRQGERLLRPAKVAVAK